MAELSLKDRLQPALLDRLIDDGRLVTIFRLTIDLEQLRQHQLTEVDVERALGLQGLRPVGAGVPIGGRGSLPAGDKASVPASEKAVVGRREGRLSAGGTSSVREYVAAGRAGNQASPRTLRVRAANSQTDIPLTSFCKIETTSAVNSQLESPDRRAMSMARLREAVLRDLGWLFNASGIDDVVDLEAQPEVRRSVLNYGLRSLAGRSVTSIEPVDVARRIRDAISFFEPRLSSVRVTPEIRGEEAEGMTLSFLVEAELWGQPMAQQLSLRTSIDVDTGDVVVSNRVGRG
jgi:type VI secretion system protein ImpF